MVSSENKAYISILAASLEEKLLVLDKLFEETKKQSEALLQTPFDDVAFEASFAVKEKLIGELNRLDDGFEETYKHVAEEIKANRDAYRSDIEKMQKLISGITDRSNALLSLEESNRNRFQIVLSTGRKKIKDFRISNKTAAAYYKNMSGIHQEGQSYFCDKKK